MINTMLLIASALFKDEIVRYRVDDERLELTFPNQVVVITNYEGMDYMENLREAFLATSRMCAIRNVDADEKLLCLDSDYVNQLVKGHLEFTGNIEDVLGECHLMFVNRNEAEKNYKVKQLVVYLEICYNDSVLIYQRSSEGESKLDGNWGFIGGHINVTDGLELNNNTIKKAAFREYQEELKDWGGYDTTIVPSNFIPYKLINLNTNDVSKLHVGVVCKVNLRLPLTNSAKRYLWTIRRNNHQVSKLNYEDWLKEYFKSLP